MEPLRRFRQSIQRLVGRALGHDTMPPRHTQGMIRWAGMEGDILRMPIDVAASSTLQNPDGSFNFVIDVSTIDGPDLIQ